MSTPTQQAVARRNENQPSLTVVVQRMVPEIQRALPKHMDGDRIARLALTVLRKDALRTDNGPRLADCTAESFAGSLLTAAALGLEPGVNGEAYLVPYARECTFIAGYQGLVKLFYQHPLAQYITAEVVYERDHFDYAKGLDPYLTHKPAKGDRGQVVYYYAAARLTTGAKDFVVLTPEEVKALRQGKVGPSGKIADPMRWMERKTAVRQLAKMMPKSPSLARALDADEQGGHDLYQQQLAAGSEPAALSAPPEELGGQAGGAGGPVEVAGPPAARPRDDMRATTGQVGRLIAKLRDLDVEGDDEQRAWFTTELRRPVEHRHDITRAEFDSLDRVLDIMIEARGEQPGGDL